MKNKSLKKSMVRYGILPLSLLVLAAPGCKTNYYSGFNKSENVVKTTYRGSFNPPGMVYIPSGMIEYKSDQNREAKKVSVSAFYIDETEVTNKQYRFFTNWVADSIAVTDYIKDEKYFHKKKSTKNLKVKDGANELRINWEVVFRDSPLWQSNDPAISEKLAPMIINNGIGKQLNKELVKYRFTYLKSNGKDANKYYTELIPVFPSESVWSNDFPNAQMEVMDLNYFKDKTYNSHPVVGVNWKQARAYADWRGKCVPFVLKSNPYLPKSNIGVSLPTEAQWQLAAGGASLDSLKDDRFYKITGSKTKKSTLAVNFKQGEGDYSQDGATMTLPVRSYGKNEFGLFNVEGNVAEWTLDAYSPSSLDLINDLNPVLKYDAEDNESFTMKRKVIRGGSWKDNAGQVSSKTRNYDIQSAAHSYIGFRCIIPAYELPSDQVTTQFGKSSKKK